jgi:NitT/TauT family transport system substrate-binding protein
VSPSPSAGGTSAARPAASSPAAASGAAGAPAASAGSAAASPVAPGTLIFGTYGGTTGGVIYSALENGYFKAEGLNVDVVPSSSAPDVIGFMAAGKMDATDSSPTPGLFNAIGQGISLKMAVAQAQLDPTHSQVGLLVLKKDADKYKSLKDLKGATIAATDWTGSSGAELALALKKEGMTPKDINLKAGPPADSFTALCNGAVQGAIVLEPFLYTAQAKDCGQLLLPFGEVLPHAQNGVIVVNERVAKDRDLSAKLIRAVRRGQLDYINAFDTNPPVNRERMVQTLVKNTPVKEAALYDKMQPALFPRDGKIDTASVDYFQQFWVEQGYQKRVIPQQDYLLDWTGLDVTPRT